jgi:SAM-dependent methyltransferase
MSTNHACDPETLAFYDREAHVYASRTFETRLPPHLLGFLDRLAPGARILELGCGSGRDAQAMIAKGFDVDATDGSSALAKEAEARLERPVRVMLFDELDAISQYDAVWANASLLHVPEPALASVLGRVYRALRSDGIFAASYKAGRGGGRDRLGRYFNYPCREALLAAYAVAGAWSSLELDCGDGGGYDDEPTRWLAVLACKG